MNVYKQRRTIELQLKRSLGSSFVVVNSPDHPLLLRPPDLLIGGDGRLTAVMLATAEETRSPSRAVWRFALSRAALPAETVFVFCIPPNDQEIVANRLASDVDEVVSWGRLVDVVGIVTRQRRSAKDQYSWKLKRLIMDRFGSAFRVAQHLRFIDRNRRGDGDFVNFRGTSGRGNTRFIPSANSHLLMGEFQGDPGPASIANLTLIGGSRSYHLDNGVPYPDTGPVGLAYAATVPAAAGDPEKYLRASAFSGWILIPNGTEYPPQKIVDLVAQRVDER